MSAKLSILLQGASSSGKSQLICWHTTSRPNPDTMQTIEETHEFLENFRGQKVLVEILDTGGNPNYVCLLEDWTSRTNAQILVINLEDALSLDYLKEHQAMLSNHNVLARLIVGNLPSGKQEQRVITSDEAAKFAATFGPQVPYLETNTRTGEGVNQVFSTLMEFAHPLEKKMVIARAPAPAPTTVPTASPLEELSTLKLRQAELEAMLQAQEKAFALRLEALEGKIHELGVANQKMQEQAFAARLEALEARLSEAKLARHVEELVQMYSKNPRTEMDTPTRPKLTSTSHIESVKQSLFTRR